MPETTRPPAEPKAPRRTRPCGAPAGDRPAPPRRSGCGDGPARPVELSLAAHAEVRPRRYPPVRAYLCGEWPRDDFEAGLTPAPAPCPDLARSS
ncbi:hypothetical protein ACF1BN_07115 [Streptomyces sp. NPDC014861]|uniref:hypothetical protein n=1 Tax=Streptomyces sp. NPDC014861 TaxID=3364923 RepID=UPI0036FAE1B3